MADAIASAWELYEGKKVIIYTRRWHIIGTVFRVFEDRRKVTWARVQDAIQIDEEKEQNVFECSIRYGDILVSDEKVDPCIRLFPEGGVIKQS